MLGSNVLDIGIGLVFTYLAISLVCTAVNELIAALFRSRARDLERGLRNLLDGTSEFPLRWWQYPGRLVVCCLPEKWRKTLTDDGKKWQLQPKSSPNWCDQFLEHQLINGTTKDGQPPVYVPSRTFVTVLMQIVSTASPGVEKSAPSKADAPAPSKADTPAPAHGPPPEGAPPAAVGGVAAKDDEKPVPPPPWPDTFDGIRRTVNKISNTKVRQALLALVEEARADETVGVSEVKKFTDRVEVWFDHAMDRVSGWYKRRTQWVLFCVALVASCALNIDSVTILRALGKNDTLRTSVAAAAGKYAEASARTSTQPSVNNPPDFGDAVKHLQSSVGQAYQIGIPMGWTSWGAAHPPSAESDATAGPYLPRSDNVYDLFHDIICHTPSVFVTKVFGLLVTAFAASLGAPFWFDVLNKFVSVRSAGRAPEERPKEPKEVLQAQGPKPTA